MVVSRRGDAHTDDSGAGVGDAGGGLWLASGAAASGGCAVVAAADGHAQGSRWSGQCQCRGDQQRRACVSAGGLRVL